jgi:hypothetical protein
MDLVYLQEIGIAMETSAEPLSTESSCPQVKREELKAYQYACGNCNSEFAWSDSPSQPGMAWRCDGCRYKPKEINEWRWFCRSCDVDYCRSCKPRLEQPVSQLSQCSIRDPLQPPSSEYAYLQIDNYRQVKYRGQKRWVSVPRGAKVHNYPLGLSCSFSVLSRKLELQPRRSSLKQARCHCTDAAEGCGSPRSSLSENGDWTKASAGDIRRVRFCDEDSAGNLMGDQGAALAEWIFVDRDICGFSVHQYAPDNEEFKDFASSCYGRLLLQECQSVRQDEPHNEKSAGEREEEKELNQALVLAGVKAQHVFLACGI